MLSEQWSAYNRGGNGNICHGEGLYFKKQAAPGTCPVSEKGLLLFDAVTLSRASFLLTIFEHDHRISVKD